MRGPAVTQEAYSGVLTKFQAFNLTKYNKVAMLDTDTLFSGLAPPDEIFEVCGDVDLCIAPGGTELPAECLSQFNAGVMVIKPSIDLLRQLLDAIARETRQMPMPEQSVLA